MESHDTERTSDLRVTWRIFTTILIIGAFFWFLVHLIYVAPKYDAPRYFFIANISAATATILLRIRDLGPLLNSTLEFFKSGKFGSSKVFVDGKFPLMFICYTYGSTLLFNPVEWPMQDNKMVYIISKPVEEILPSSELILPFFYHTGKLDPKNSSALSELGYTLMDGEEDKLLSLMKALSPCATPQENVILEISGYSSTTEFKNSANFTHENSKPLNVSLANKRAENLWNWINSHSSENIAVSSPKELKKYEDMNRIFTDQSENLTYGGAQASLNQTATVTIKDAGECRNKNG